MYTGSLHAEHQMDEDLDSTPPDPMILFTVLYGIYPCNFTAFLKDAVGYLREKKWQSPTGEGGIGLNSAMVRERSHVSLFLFHSSLSPHSLAHFSFVTAYSTTTYSDSRLVRFRPLD